MAIYHSCGICEISFDFCRCDEIKPVGPPIKQKNSYTCGPIAIRNSCWALGIKIPSVSKIAKACETDTDGTSISGLRHGAKISGLKLNRIFVSSKEEVEGVLMCARFTPLILGYTVAGEGHYCVIISRYQLTSEMVQKRELIALNWNHDTVVAFGSHANLLAESTITSEWLVGKLLARGTDVYLVSERK